MDKSSWRSKANIVVCYETVILVLSVGLVVLLGDDLNFGTFLNKEPHGPPVAQEGRQDRNDSQHQHHIDWKALETRVFGVPIPTYIFWIIYILFVVATGVRFGIVISLFKATSNRTSQNEALCLARTWTEVMYKFMYFEAVILPFSLGAVLFTTGPVLILSLILLVCLGFDFWRKVEGVCVLYEFINELQKQPPVRTNI